MYDLIIVGGGPAGMTAAVYTARKKLNALLLSRNLGGQPLLTAEVENYMGYQYVSGPELMRKFADQVKQFDLERRIGEEVQNLSHGDSSFQLTTDDSLYEAKSLIIATGKRPRTLNVPGEGKFRGKGVTYCAVCDAPVFSGMNVAVVGGGNSALEAVDDLLKYADHVYLLSSTPITGDAVLFDRIRQSPKLEIMLEHEVVEILGTHMLEAILVRDLKTAEHQRLPVGGIFIEIGLIPNSTLVKDLVHLNQAGEIQIDCANRTEVPGLFAAGDVTNVADKQIVIAAGEGAKAALEAHKYLQKLPTQTNSVIMMQRAKE